MSENIVIQEGGVGKSLTVDRLRTDKVGGGTCLWVPEDEIILGTKSITNNGTYSAATDGLTGFSQVTVNVPEGNVTGRDPVTGQEKSVTVDPETGDLVETVVPSEIRVITPPTNPYGVYVDGQTITKDGMVVKAYDANGVYMQDVPVGEITINPTVAVYDSSKDKGITGEATVSDTTGLRQDTIDALPIGYGTQIIGSSQAYESGVPGGANNMITSLTHTDTVYTFALENDGSVLPYTCSKEPFSGVSTTHNPGGSRSYNRNFISRATTVKGQNVYLQSVWGTGQWSYSTPPTSMATHAEQIAYVILYGTRDETPAGSPQTITVSWPRPGDSKVLTATFDILVGPRSGQGDD